VEYTVVSQKINAMLASNVAKRNEEFARVVNEHLRSGWEPIGGVAIGSNGTSNYLYQALIKRR
jgi:hypothetical protein